MNNSTQGEYTCNQNTFSNHDNFNEGVAIAIIVLNCVLLLYFLVKMCKLCSYAFSYSNYHIHQTYKLYALSIINIMAALLVRKTQIDLHDFIQTRNPEQSSEIQADPNTVGYYIINDVFGIVSILTNNMLLLFNAFNWLAIAKDCDFTVTDDSKLINVEQLENLSDEASMIRVNHKEQRKNIYYAKIYFLYCFLPLLLVLSLFGTLNHRLEDSWCTIISVSTIVSSFIPLIVFCIAFALYLKKFSDPEVSLKTKIGLVYLLIAIIVRSIFYLTFIIKKEDAQSWSAGSNLAYVIFCSLAPMFVMTLLSEVQLHKQQFNILRRSSGLIFKSTII